MKKPFNYAATKAGAKLITRDGNPATYIGCSCLGQKFGAPEVFFAEVDLGDRASVFRYNLEGVVTGFRAVSSHHPVHKNDLFLEAPGVARIIRLDELPHSLVVRWPEKNAYATYLCVGSYEGYERPQLLIAKQGENVWFYLDNLCHLGAEWADLQSTVKTVDRETAGKETIVSLVWKKFEVTE